MFSGHTLGGMKHFVTCSALCFLILSSVSLRAQEDIVRYAMVLQGVSSPDELDEGVVELYENLLHSRVRINLASEGRLRSCGLFSGYQVASIRDYRMREGDILSSAELALLDGFDREYVQALSAFISFESGNLPGKAAADSLVWTGEAHVRTAMAWKEGGESASRSIKLKAGAEDRLEVAVAGRIPAGLDSGAEISSLSAAYYGEGHLSKLVVGDVTARFGQGLVMWSGFSLTGFSSASSFAKHPSGIGRAWTLSQSSAGRGAAAALVFGRMEASVMYSIDSGALLNLTYWGRRGQAGVTLHSEGLASFDFRCSRGKFDIFSETALDAKDGSAASLLGMTCNPAYQKRISAVFRWYPTEYTSSYASPVRSSSKTNDEIGLALAADWHNLVVSLDCSAHPESGQKHMKGMLEWSTEKDRLFVLSTKSTARYRPQDTSPLRLEQRLTLDWDSSFGMSLRASGDICHCKALSSLAYVEAMWKSSTQKPKFSLSMRASLFFADDWEDRIYCYERDIPGMFSVPAFYGRGWKCSSVVGMRIRRLTLNARASVLSYSFMKEQKPGKTELKVNVSYEF